AVDIDDGVLDLDLGHAFSLSDWSGEEGWRRSSEGRHRAHRVRARYADAQTLRLPEGTKGVRPYPPCAAVQSLTTRSSTVRGTPPASSTMSWKARMSKRAPSRALASARRRSMTVWPTL